MKVDVKANMRLKVNVKVNVNMKVDMKVNVKNGSSQGQCVVIVVIINMYIAVTDGVGFRHDAIDGGEVS